MRQIDAYRLAGLLASRYQAETIINIRCGARRELMTFADVHNIGRNSGWNLQHCVPKFPRGEWIDIDLETSRHMDNRTVSGAIVLCTDVLENPKEPTRVLEILIPSGRCPHHHHP